MGLNFLFQKEEKISAAVVFSGPPEAVASPLLVSEMGISSQKAWPLPGCLSPPSKRNSQGPISQRGPQAMCPKVPWRCAEAPRRREVARPEADRMEQGGG
ncbi:unnamed protein product [Rangifer tarandus platyrhynchus]|uniref:Uncharacterized protein n=1 Tax=Rangifer tarandus platyrhynchus TaxID=3082113 RepID=A0ABN8YWE6_RANTA|nr:unnamed protein product [Rangifer tarandus platyrhynchus]